MPFYVGTFSKPINRSKVIRLHKPEDTELLKHGDHVEQWDNIFEWDEHCLTVSQCMPWRAQGDPLCDNALKEVFSHVDTTVGHDVFELVVKRATENPSGYAASFITEVSKVPPKDIATAHETLLLGQRFYLKHSAAIMQSLLHFSLAGGFASPPITQVLRSVSYLVNNNSQKAQEQSQAGKDRTYTRLAETFQFILAVMGCTQPSSAKQDCLLPGGEGWKAILRVRLLHGIARRRAVKSQSIHHQVGEIPINQEDLAATLGSFCVVPLLCLPRQYLIPIRGISSREEAAFVALWRHVGFYLGIEPSILVRYFSSPEIATKFLASVICHILPSNVDPQADMFNPPTIEILQATANRPPFPKSFKYNSALSRKLLGDSLSTHLGIPPTISLSTHLHVMFDLIRIQLPVLFGQVYPRKRWEEQRLSLTKIGLERLVRFQLGQRRSAFRPRRESGEIDDKILQLEHCELDAEGRQRLMKGWKRLISEMKFALSFVALFAFGTAYFTSGYVSHTQFTL